MNHQNVIATFPANKVSRKDKARIGRRVRITWPSVYGFAGTIVDVTNGPYFWVQLDDRMVGVCDGLIGLEGDGLEEIAA